MLQFKAQAALPAHKQLVNSRALFFAGALGSLTPYPAAFIESAAVSAGNQQELHLPLPASAGTKGALPAQFLMF